jgi:hypothetical protein
LTGSLAEDGRRSNKRSTRPSSKLEWVHSDAQTVASGQTEENRRLVRSHVMAEHRRKKRLQDIERYQKTRFSPLPLRLMQRPAAGQTSSSVPEKHLKGSTDVTRSRDIAVDSFIPLPWVDRLHDAGVEDEENQILSVNKVAAGQSNRSLCTYVGQGSGDPFCTMATNLTERMQGHLHYCKLPSILCSDIGGPIHPRPSAQERKRASIAIQT